MNIYSYVITRDYGFAPNPFGEFCTLATCKPYIRKNAVVGDWVIGTGSNSIKCHIGNKLIYAMRVDEKVSFERYWNDERFQYKKPILNGSKKQMYGDNIYFMDKNANNLVQVNSHHSHDDGTTNQKNYDRDTKGEYVLISKKFWYWGINAPEIPPEICDELIKTGIGFKKIIDPIIIEAFIKWISTFAESGYIAEPHLFKGDFKRYDGN